MWIGHRKEIRKLTFRALAFRRSELKNCGFCMGYSYIDRKIFFSFFNLRILLTIKLINNYTIYKSMQYST